MDYFAVTLCIRNMNKMSDNNATKYAQPHCLVHNTKTFDPSLVEMSMMWVGGELK